VTSLKATNLQVCLCAGQRIILCGLDLKVGMRNVMLKIRRDVEAKDQDGQRFDI
jgi:hypothetical protein